MSLTKKSIRQKVNVIFTQALTILFVGFFVACSPSKNRSSSDGSASPGDLAGAEKAQLPTEQPLQDTVTIDPKSPQKVKVGDSFILRGPFSVKNAKYSFDQNEQKIRLKTDIAIPDINIEIKDIVFEGLFKDNVTANLYLQNESAQKIPNGFVVVAQAICLIPEDQVKKTQICGSAYIDVIAEFNGQKYTVQVSTSTANSEVPSSGTAGSNGNTANESAPGSGPGSAQSSKDVSTDLGASPEIPPMPAMPKSAKLQKDHQQNSVDPTKGPKLEQNKLPDFRNRRKGVIEAPTSQDPNLDIVDGNDGESEEEGAGENDPEAEFSRLSPDTVDALLDMAKKRIKNPSESGSGSQSGSQTGNEGDRGNDSVSGNEGGSGIVQNSNSSNNSNKGETRTRKSNLPTDSGTDDNPGSHPEHPDAGKSRKTPGSSVAIQPKVEQLDVQNKKENSQISLKPSEQETSNNDGTFMISRAVLSTSHVQNKQECQGNKVCIARIQNRPFNQASGMPNRGSLSRANSLQDIVSLPEAKNGDRAIHFRIVNPQRKRYFGTYDMMRFLEMLSNRTTSILNKSKSELNYKVLIADVARKGGGCLGGYSSSTKQCVGHKSHRTGIDVDIAYVLDSKKQSSLNDVANNSKITDRNFDVEANWNMVDWAVNSDFARIIFSGPAIKKSLCAYASKLKKTASAQRREQIDNALRAIKTNEPGHNSHFHFRLNCSTFDLTCRNLGAPAPNTGCP